MSLNLFLLNHFAISFTMKTHRLAAALYALLIVFLLTLSILRFNHQLSGESFWRLFILALVLGGLVRLLPRGQAKKA